MRLNHTVISLYNLTFNLHEFIFYSIYTTLTLSVYSRVLGYFWLSRLKPKNEKNIKKPLKNQKKQISNLKNHWFFHPRFFDRRTKIQVPYMLFSRNCAWWPIQ